MNRTRENSKVKEVDPKPPKMTIDPITDDGTLNIRFNQQMYFPLDKMNQKFYNTLFRITYISNGGDTKYETKKFEDGSEKGESRRVQAEDDEDEEQDQLSGIQVLNHTSQLLSIKFDFNNPNFVSRGNSKDQISITFL